MIKKVCNNLKDGLKFIFQKYPVTVFLVILLSFLICVFDYDKYEILGRIYTFSVLFIMGVLFSELSFLKKKTRYFAFGGFFIISLLINYFIFNAKNDFVDLRIIIPYGITLGILILYRFYKNSKMTIKEYFLSTFINVFKTMIMYYLIIMGVTFIIGIFSSLILGNFDLELLLRIYILMGGIFYVPNILNDLSGRKVNTDGFAKIVIHYILDPIIIISFVVVYIYILKIILTWNMPSNEVFRILALLFIMGLPIWIMNDNYKKDVISQINHYLPIAFIPFIILEIYALMVRIITCGITIPRYLGIMLIIFQIIYTLIHILKKEKIEYCYYALIGLTIITFSTPFINAFDLSNRSQVNVIKHYIVKEELTSKEKGRIMDAYHYLLNSSGGSDYIQKYLVNDEEKIKGIIHDISDFDDNTNTVYINEKIDDILIDTNEYKHMESFKKNINNEDKVILYHNNREIDITNKIIEFVEMRKSTSFHEYFISHNTIVLDNTKIVLTKINLSYQGEIKYIDIEGFILWR